MDDDLLNIFYGKEFTRVPRPTPIPAPSIAPSEYSSCFSPMDSISYTHTRGTDYAQEYIKKEEELALKV